jgi:hypothetical protein
LLLAGLLDIGIQIIQVIGKKVLFVTWLLI